MTTWYPTRKQLVCRDIQHAWTPYTARSVKDQGVTTGFIRVFICSRCSTVKSQVIDTYGYLVSTSMKYTPGYVRPGEGRFTRDDRANLRLENLRDIGSREDNDE